MIKRAIRFSALGALIATPALADDLIISTATTASVNTAEAAGGTAGDITVTETGSITLGVLPIPDGETEAPAAVPAITLNSTNSVTNDGSVIVRHFEDPVGIFVTDGAEGNVTIGGSVLVEGEDDGVEGSTGDAFNSADGIGLLLDSSGSFTGNIVTEAGSSITAHGASSTGIFLQSEIIGDVLLGGSTTAMGNSAVGVRTTDSITGSFRNTGSIISGPRDDGDGTTVPVSPSSALLIGGGVSEGILNDGPDGDATPNAEIRTQGSSPALRISPATAFGADLTVGQFTDIGLTDYSFINRGEILSQPIWPNVDAIGARIGGSNNFDTIFTGTMFNSGSIRALATSDNAAATGASTNASDATALIFDARSTVPELHNSETGIIEAMTDGPLGGNAIAIDIDNDASLASLINNGSILANAFSTGEAQTGLNAYAIRDRSGTLLNIENSGTISATASGTDTTTIVVDLSESTAPIVFANTGTVIGDVLFGGAVGASTFTIQGADASVTGAVSSGGTVDITISGDGSGGTLITSGVRNAGIFDVGFGGVVDVEIGLDDGPLVDAQGAGSFAAGSSLFLTPVSFLKEQEYEIVRADGGLTVAAGVTDTADVPFLFNGTFSTDANSLFLDVTLKSTTALGLAGDSAAIFPGVARAALKDDELGALLLGLSSNGAVQDTVKQFVPHDNNVPRSVALKLTDPQGSNIAGRQRRLQMHPEATDDGGVWATVGYDIFVRSSAAGYDGNGGGGTIGIDWGERDGGHFGVAYTFFHGGADGKDITARTVDVDWNMFSLYMGVADGPAFANAQVNVGLADVEGKREINVGGLSRIAETRDWTETLASGSVSAGYVFDLGDLQFVPQGGVEYMSLNRSSYTESKDAPA